MSILVVEDNGDLRETVTEILQIEGYRVVAATNGLLALDAVALTHYRLILLDIHMPVLDGLGFLTAYASQPEPHSPVIICSGTSDFLPEILPSFVIARLSKPYAISHLLTLITKYIQPA